MHNLMDRGRGRHPRSRDFDLPVIPCAVDVCPANNGRGHCAMPSCIKILANGKCEQGVKAREATRKT